MKFFYKVKKKGSNGKRHYILPVCNMTCHNQGIFLIFKKFCLLTVYIYTFEI